MKLIVDELKFHRMLPMIIGKSGMHGTTKTLLKKKIGVRRSDDIREISQKRNDQKEDDKKRRWQEKNNKEVDDKKEDDK